MAFPLLAGAGALFALGGAALSGRASDMARKRLEDVALTPPLDVNAVTGESLTGIERYLPRATAIGARMNDYYSGEMERMLETSMPGYRDRRASALGNIDSWLAGRLTPENVSEIYRNTAGRAIAGGYSGTGMHASAAARNLGLGSLALQQYAMGQLPSLRSAFPAASPVSISELAGLTPTQLVNLRSTERAQKMSLMAQQAVMPGQTSIWGSTLTQLGGGMLGAGIMQSVMGSPAAPVGAGANTAAGAAGAAAGAAGGMGGLGLMAGGLGQASWGF